MACFIVERTHILINAMLFSKGNEVSLINVIIFAEIHSFHHLRAYESEAYDRISIISIALTKPVKSFSSLSTMHIVSGHTKCKHCKTLQIQRK